MLNIHHVRFITLWSKIIYRNFLSLAFCTPWTWCVLWMAVFIAPLPFGLNRPGSIFYKAFWLSENLGAQSVSSFLYGASVWVAGLSAVGALIASVHYYTQHITKLGTVDLTERKPAWPLWAASLGLLILTLSPLSWQSTSTLACALLLFYPSLLRAKHILSWEREHLCALKDQLLRTHLQHNQDAQLDSPALKQIEQAMNRHVASTRFSTITICTTLMAFFSFAVPLDWTGIFLAMAFQAPEASTHQAATAWSLTLLFIGMFFTLSSLLCYVFGSTLSGLFLFFINQPMRQVKKTLGHILTKSRIFLTMSPEEARQLEVHHLASIVQKRSADTTVETHSKNKGRL